MSYFSIRNSKDYNDLVFNCIEKGDYSKIARLEASGLDKLFGKTFKDMFSKSNEAAKYYKFVDNVPTKKDFLNRMDTFDAITSQFVPPPIEFCVAWNINGNISNGNELKIVFANEGITREMCRNTLRVVISTNMSEEIKNYALSRDLYVIRMEIPRYPINYNFVYKLAEKFKVEICLADSIIAHTFLARMSQSFSFLSSKNKGSIFEETFGTYSICCMKKGKNTSEKINKVYFCCLRQDYEPWTILEEMNGMITFVSGPGAPLLKSMR